MRSRLDWYGKLLQLYPRAYRDTYTGQMQQTLRDMLHDQPSRLGREAIWLRTLADTGVSLVKQHAYATADFRTPDYLRRASIIAAFLVLPFVVAVVVNSIVVAATGRGLYQTWAWSTPVLTAWVLVLPAAAVLLSIATYIYFWVHLPERSVLGRLATTAKTWPFATAGIVGVGILCTLVFHDSVHCVAQNPIRTVRNASQTWQCIQDGTFGGN
jgi:phosphoglycerol transferase MdoB-like AlkP superfamily enzyme